jgi:hypothetical protein
MGFWEAGELLVQDSRSVGDRERQSGFRSPTSRQSVKSGYGNYPVTHARHYTDSRNLMRRLTVSEWVGTASFLGLGVVLAPATGMG